MLPSLLIQNFRIFKHLKIESLGRVNLFVGKNSTGKSCLLEAVRFFVSGGNPAVLQEMISFRDEDYKVSEWDDEEFFEPWRYVFNGYKLPVVGGEGIFIGQDSVRNKFIRLRLEEKDASLETESEKISIRSFLADSGATKAFWSRYNKRINIKIQSIPSRRETQFDTSVLWDNIDMTDLEKEVIGAISMIQRNIVGIAFKREGVGRYEIVRLEGSNERVPMKSLGDGVVRIFHIILGVCRT